MQFSNGRDILSRLWLFGALNAAVSFTVQLRSIDWQKSLPLDASGLVVGRDFLNVWFAGAAAYTADPGANYQYDTYARALAALLGPDYPTQIWSYPPIWLLFAWPFGALPYLVGLALFLAFSIALYIQILRSQFLDKRLYWAGLLAPACLFSVVSGQFALLIAAIWLTAWPRLDRRPWLAGFLLGLLSLKPQVAIMLAVMLLVTGRWRVIAAGVLTTLGLVSATLVLWGPKLWEAYIDTGIGNQLRVLTDPLLLAAPFMPTLFVGLRRLGLSIAEASLGQTLAMIACLACTVRYFWGRARQEVSMTDLAFLLAAGAAATPYLMIYDTLPLALAMLLIQVRREAATSATAIAPLTVAVYLLPLLHLIGNAAHLALGWLAVAAIMVVLVRYRVATAHRSRSETGIQPTKAQGHAEARPDDQPQSLRG